jgi:hypothetical protein
MSNSERIERAAAEAAAFVRDKKAAKALAPKAPRKSSRAAPVRMKVVWTVSRPGAATVKTFPYKEREAADAEAARVGKGAVVGQLKVPME